MKKSTLIIIVLIAVITAFGFGAGMESNKLDDKLIAAEIELSTITTCHDSAKKNIDKYSKENDAIKAENEKLNNELNDILAQICIYEDRKTRQVQQSSNETTQSEVVTVEASKPKQKTLSDVANTYVEVFESFGYRNVEYNYMESYDTILFTMDTCELYPRIYDDFTETIYSIDHDLYSIGYTQLYVNVEVYNDAGIMLAGDNAEGIYTDYVPVQ